jgi:hypothetical protein
MPGSLEQSMSTGYVITVRGHLDDHWAIWFEGMAITNCTNGEATLVGPVVDQAALHGLLMKIRDLGLPLIAVVPGRKLGDDRPEDGEAGDGSTEPWTSATETAASPPSQHLGA